MAEQSRVLQWVYISNWDWDTGVFLTCCFSNSKHSREPRVVFSGKHGKASSHSQWRFSVHRAEVIRFRLFQRRSYRISESAVYGGSKMSNYSREHSLRVFPSMTAATRAFMRAPSETCVAKGCKMTLLHWHVWETCQNTQLRRNEALDVKPKQKGLFLSESCS